MLEPPVLITYVLSITIPLVPPFDRSDACVVSFVKDMTQPVGAKPGQPRVRLPKEKVRTAGNV
jgi:hypothetical protein